MPCSPASPLTAGDGFDADDQPPIEQVAQTGGGAPKGAEPSHLIRVELEPAGEGEYGGVRSLTLVEPRRDGFENRSEDDEIRTGMLCQQMEEPVVVPDAVAGPAQFLKSFGRGMGIDGQSLPDERVRAFHETPQDQAVSLRMRQCEVVGGRGHDDGLSESFRQGG